MTTAQQVSALLDDDGQQWKAADGRDLDQLAEAHGARCTENRSGDGGRRFAFPDGSAIVAFEGGWDLGFPALDGCYCWAGVAGDYPESDGHLPECPHAPEAPADRPPYTVREPGCSFWSETSRPAEAARDLERARAAGLHRARIYDAEAADVTDEVLAAAEVA